MACHTVPLFKGLFAACLVGLLAIGGLVFDCGRSGRLQDRWSHVERRLTIAGERIERRVERLSERFEERMRHVEERLKDRIEHMHRRLEYLHRR